MKSGNIAHQIVEAVSCYSSGSIQINAVKTLHDICVVGDLKIRNHWLTELLDLYIFTVILTPGKIMMNVWPGIGVNDWLKPFDGTTPLTASYEWVTYQKASKAN